MQVEGWDAVNSARIIKDTFSWGEMELLGERPRNIVDRNLNTVAETEERGLADLRMAEIFSGESVITAPVNCGQQVYDVIEVTDAVAGLNAAKKRVTGLTLVYNPRHGEFNHRLKLGRV
jgi:hypothetical protein